MPKSLSSIHPSWWSIAGLVVNLLGVLLLFRFGIPYYIHLGGAVVLVTGVIDKDAARAEEIAGVIGWIGLTLVFLGTILQIVGSYRARSLP